MAISSTVKILDKTRLRKVRKLSVPGDILVKPGDSVKPDTMIGKSEFVKGTPYVIDLRAELREPISPEFVDKVLLKKVGDKVKAREVIARYQKSFWSEAVEVRSPCDGVIEYISRVQGRLVVREDPRSAKPLTIVAVSSRLGVWPRLIRMYTEVKEGDQVFEGQIIAAAPGVGSVDYVYAPMSGIVEKICSQTGTVTIVRPIKPTRVLAHIEGMVTEVIPDEGAVIEALGSYVEGVFGLGGERFGELAVLCDSPHDTLEESGVPADVKGKILVAGAFATLEAIQKARSSGALGLIVGGLNQLDLVQLIGREINVGITGHEECDLTVILLEGFGKMPMNEKAWRILKEREGRIASIDGTTQIRAGVMRPEILISEGSVAGPAQVTAGGAWSYPDKENRIGVFTGLKVGDRVRCIRSPYFGLWGNVEEIPSEPERVECEAYMEVVRVRLDDGRVVTVPEANLEVFREENLSRE